MPARLMTSEESDELRSRVAADRTGRTEVLPAPPKSPPLMFSGFEASISMAQAEAYQEIANKLKAGELSVFVVPPGLTIHQLIDGRWELLISSTPPPSAS